MDLQSVLNIFLYAPFSLGILNLCLALALLLALNQIGIFILQFLLNANHPDAPDYNFENYVATLVRKICDGLNIRSYAVEALAGGYAILYEAYGSSRYYWYKDGNMDFTGSQASYFEDRCLFKNKEEALAVSRELAEKRDYFNCLVVLKTLSLFIVLDVMLWLSSIAFLPTVILCGVIVTIYGVRTISAKVYENSSKIKNNTSRITNLEEKGE